eukprot:TRINITY_DN1818_c0_g1_i2.p1 TRINITY_DN1818_c0_g1~~TRINITY_DN1818_c0_g1_i2.p1  ORF type:complete len:488 (+),score=18.60 TRINITY_DN1818_c0_g1_i2:83-1465(+)
MPPAVPVLMVLSHSAVLAAARAPSERPWTDASQRICRTTSAGALCVVGKNSFAMNFSRCAWLIPREKETRRFKARRVGSSTLGVPMVINVEIHTSKGFQRIALKPACRPGIRHRGAQAWAEVAAHHIEHALFGEMATSTCATGVKLPVFENMLPSSRSSIRCGPVSGMPGMVVGTAMPWLPFVSDDSTPPEVEDAPRLFTPTKRPKLSAAEREWAGNFSSLLALDFLVLNPDRLDDNWHRAGKLAAVDNGAAFGGPAGAWNNWNGSICDHDFGEYRSCPHVLRYALAPRQAEPGLRVHNSMRGCQGWRARASECQRLAGRCAAAGVEWCIFRPGLLTRLRDFAVAWRAGLGKAWARGLERDPLVAHLFANYNFWGTGALDQLRPSNPHLIHSVALYRYVHGCPMAPKLEEVNATAPFDPSVLLQWLAYGIGGRVRTLTEHIRGCVARHGEEYVFGSKGAA